MASSEGRPFKRQRVSAYPKGSVLKVEVRNFMTYKHAIIEPGPKLNLVLGPNGSGKSSLVCALCVGLAGKTNLLGRAEDVSSFVRRGADSGWVEVTLASGDPLRPHVVHREIFAGENKSNWQINRREARLKDVEELVRDRLKVQLENLCQFLPQDKVSDFARMKPVDLLEATEKAIGNGELFEQHRRLIEERATLARHDHHMEALGESLGQLRAENARSTRDVHNIQLRETLLEEVKLAKQKLPWVRFKERKKVHDEDKQKRDAAKQALQTLQRAQAQDAGPLAEREALLKRLQAEKKEVARRFKAAEDKLTGEESLEDAVNAAIEEVTSKKDEIGQLGAAAADRERRLVDLRATIQALTQEVADLPALNDYGELGVRRQQLVLEQRDVHVQDADVGRQVEEKEDECAQAVRSCKAAEERLRRIDNSKMQRLQALNAKHIGIQRTWEWVQANKGRFRGPVWGPIALEVECPDPQHVKYLEQQVAAQTWSFFVTKFREDQDLLREEARTHCNFRPSISCYQGDEAQPITHPRGEAAEYARFGVSQTLDACFTAPAIVKKVLCDESRVHEAYVGSADTPVTELFNQCSRPQLLYTPGGAFKRTVSQYNRDAESFAVSDIRQPRVLVAGAAAAGAAGERAAAVAEVERCKQELRGLQEELEVLRAAKKAKAAQLAALKRQQKDIDGAIHEQSKRHTGLRTKLKSKENELAREQKKDDPRKREPQLRREVEAAQKRAFEKALELAMVQTSVAELLVRRAAVELGIREASMQIDALKEASKQHEADVARYQRNLDQLTQITRQSADECRRLKAAAEEVVALTDELKEAWGELPDGEQELREHIEQKSADAEGMAISNPAALRQYTERCRRIAEQEAELAGVQEQRQLARATIDAVSGAWLPRLKQVVAAVNATFSANFASVGCAGDVVLHEAAGEDYVRYAIEIRVKFRDAEALQTLDANRQSGGERSVSTILYLIALQGVTVTPFRVVDEINQGMDPVNERKVFMQLVEAACRDGTPQCFLLTPKLLPDLPFTRDVTVLQIMNGCHIKDVASGFSMEKLLGAAHMRQLTAAA